MRDETELRSAIDTLAGPRPDAGELHDRLMAAVPTTGPGAHRRVVVPLLVAATVAALAIAGAVLAGVSNHGRANPSGADASVPLTWRFSVGRVPGLTVVRDWAVRSGDVDSGVTEFADISSTHGGPTTGLLIFDTDPGKTVTGGRSFVADGMRYYFRAGKHVTRQGGLTRAQYAQDPWRAAGQDAHGPQLAWHYADGSQVILTGTFGFRPQSYDYDNTLARRDLLRIARAVHTGRHDPVQMPFAPAALPRGLEPVFSRYTPPGTFGRSRGDAISVNACITYAEAHRPPPRNFIQGVFDVCRIATGSSARAALDAVLPSDQVGLRVVRRLSDGTMLAVASGSGTEQTISRVDLRRVAERTDVSPELGRPSTWLPLG